jgi:hypothetical protein
LILVVAVGLALGVGAYTFVYARGAEAARVLAESIDFTRQRQLALREPRPR